MNAVTTRSLLEKKAEGQRIVAITAYDYFTAKLLDEAQYDMILVGDSLGMTVLGYPDTLSVTMQDMIHHGQAVVRAVQYSFVVIDMPFMSYQVSVEQALKNAGKLVQKTGARAVKLEGGAQQASRIAAITQAGIPVCGHIGLEPQSVHQLGGYAKQGKTEEQADRLKKDALALQEAGCFAFVLECVDESLAREITEICQIPVIGIGAGAACDGQIMVVNDILGTYHLVSPAFAKSFNNLGEQMKKAFEDYKTYVTSGDGRACSKA